MSRKKKIILSIGILFIVITVSGFAFVMTTTACGFSQERVGPGFHKKGIPPFMQQEIGKFILWRLDQGSKNLNLTREQQKKYDQLISALQNTMEKGIQTRLQIKTLFHSQIKKETPDLLAVTQTFQTHLNSITEIFNTNLTLFNTFYASLDVDQKRQITEKIKEKHSHHKKNYPCDDI